METGKIINQISNRLRSRSQAIHTQLGIGSAQGKILNYVLVESVHHPVYQKDLENEFGLRASTVTEMLNALERKELISRIADEQDGRYKKIAFTEKALVMKDLIRQEVEGTESLLLQGISPEEEREFMRIARKMLGNLDQELEPDSVRKERTK